MIGDLNPFPVQIGGGPSRAETVYNSLRKMMGANGYCADEDSFEAEWRKCKSLGLACLSSFDERAANQAFPNTATDHIPLFEEMLGLPIDELRTPEERRQDITPEYIGVPMAWWSELDRQLKRIDIRASLVVRLWENAGTTIRGRAFQAYIPDPGFEYDPLGVSRFTQYPAVSDMYRANVLYDIGNGQTPDKTILDRTTRIKSLLPKVLPAWVDYSIVYSIGFVLDTSLLDATGFGT